MCGRYLVDDEVYSDMWEILNAPAMGTLPAAGVSPAAGMLPAAGMPAAAGTLPNMSSNITVGEVFPTNIAPVITCGGVEAVKWGFPNWKGSGVIINARAETASEKIMFRKPLLERRCVIPSSGFYEWDRVGGGKKKDKYLLRRQGERVLYMAGMIGMFRGAAGCGFSAFVILTTAASSSVALIHNRMPVILEPDERSYWLGDDRFMEYALRRPGFELVLEVQ
jgi:putative SOS response-associated peptidase YedK